MTQLVPQTYPSPRLPNPKSQTSYKLVPLPAITVLKSSYKTFS